jgi:tape measure domain-containing protein
MASRFSIEATFSAVDKITAPVTKMERVTRQLSTGIKRDFMSAQIRMENFGESIKRNLSTGLMLGAVGAITGIGFALKYAVTEASRMENSFAQFTTLLGGNSDAAKKLVQDLQVLGAQTPYEFKDLADATQRLLGFGVATKDNVVPTLKMLGDLSQGSAEKLQGISLVYGQIMAGGKMMGQDFNQFINQGVPIAQGLAKVWGVDVNEAIKRVKQNGPVMAADVLKAMQQMTSEGGLFFNGMIRSSQTASGLFSTMMDAISMTATGIGTALLPVMKEIAIQITNAATKTLEWVNSNQGLLSDKITSYWESLKSGISTIISIVEVLYSLRYVLGTVIGLWYAYRIAMNTAAVATWLFKGAMTAIRIAMLINTAIHNSWILSILWGVTAYTASTAATTALTAATWLFNTALLANPITWIVAGIVALGAAVAAIIYYWDDLSGAITKATQKLQVFLGIRDIEENQAERMNNIDKYTSSGFGKFSKGFAELIGMDLNKPASETQTNRREVQTQGQQIAQSINTNKNTSQNITNTQTREVKLVVQNQNQSSIKLNQAFLDGW